MRKECIKDKNGRGVQKNHAITMKKAFSFLSAQIQKEVLKLVEELDLECVGVTTINNDNYNTNS